MLFWCTFNIAINYICTPSVLIVEPKTMYWTLHYFTKQEKKFSLVILVWKTRKLGKPGNLENQDTLQYPNIISSDSIERVTDRDRQEISFIFAAFFCEDLFQENSKTCLIVWLPFHDTQPLSVTYLTAIWGKSKIYGASGALGQIFIMIIAKRKGNLKNHLFKIQKIAFAELNTIC